VRILYEKYYYNDIWHDEYVGTSIRMRNLPPLIYIYIYILKAISIHTFRIKVERSHERAQMIKARRYKQLIAQI